MISVRRIYDTMFEQMGKQGWWPAETKCEIIVGAFLVQNTNWNNAVKALGNLREETRFIPEKINELKRDQLEMLIRPSRFYKNKAKGISTFFEWFEQYEYSYNRVNQIFGDNLRKELLTLYCVGKETADVMLLYVFDRIVFIADRYAQRLFSELTNKTFDSYDDLKRYVNIQGVLTLEEAKEFHGLIDEFGKEYFNRRNNFYNSFLIEERERYLEKGWSK